MSNPVRTTLLADLHILELDAWWRRHREEAPDSFEQELALALRAIAAAPHAGERYPHPSGRVRRVVMRATETTCTTSKSPTTCWSWPCGAA